jgi:hypothetical protein
MRPDAAITEPNDTERSVRRQNHRVNDGDDPVPEIVSPNSRLRISNTLLPTQYSSNLNPFCQAQIVWAHLLGRGKNVA